MHKEGGSCETPLFLASLAIAAAAVEANDDETDEIRLIIDSSSPHVEFFLTGR